VACPSRAWGHGRCGHACCRIFTMESSIVQKRRGAYLPHWSKLGGIYCLRFRLCDSVPQEKIREWENERRDIIMMAQRQKRELTYQERLALLKLHSESVDRFLRGGHGACWMKQENIAKEIAGALRFFEGQRYRLFAWCVMPNHVHVVVQPFSEHTLSSIVCSWKSFSAKRSNALLGKRGQFWQSEYFDRLIRSQEQLDYSIEYTWSNPELAGLKNWEWRWRIPEEQLKKENLDHFFARAQSPCPHGRDGHATTLLDSSGI